MKVIAQNKKALFDYEIFERFEAGIVLTGDEVKSLREGKVSLIGAFATVHDGQLLLINCTITPYARAYKKSEDAATRSRTLLVHRKQISRLVGDISRKGVTVLPLKLYFNKKNIVKVELGIGKHRKAIGKKQIIRERDIERQMHRELKDLSNS